MYVKNFEMIAIPPFTNLAVIIPYKCVGIGPRDCSRITLQWRHNGRDRVSNHQPHDCLLNRLFRRRSKKTSNSASLAFVRGSHREPVNSPHKGQLRGKWFHLMTSSWYFDIHSKEYTRCVHSVKLHCILTVAMKYICSDRIQVSKAWISHDIQQNTVGYYQLPLVCWRGYGNLSTRSIAIPRAAEGQAWYCDAKCG